VAANETPKVLIHTIRRSIDISIRNGCQYSKINHSFYITGSWRACASVEAGAPIPTRRHHGR
jgi:hypothetical protein